MAGTPFATYEIGLNIEIRDREGKPVKKIENAHTYQGKATPRFPTDAEYFSNHATAGIRIRDPGNFKVAFIFTDRSRPSKNTAPVETLFDVRIE